MLCGHLGALLQVRDKAELIDMGPSLKSCSSIPQCLKNTSPRGPPARLACIIGLVLQQGGSESPRRWVTCPRSLEEAVEQQGCWTRRSAASTACSQPSCLSAAGSSCWSWSKNGWGGKEKKKNQILVFFHPKESQLFFSRTPCSRFDTLSPKDFLGVFSLFVLRGGKGGVWVAPEPSGTRQNILMPGESNLSCPQARWRWPSSLHWSSWTGHTVSLPRPFPPT